MSEKSFFNFWEYSSIPAKANDERTLQCLKLKFANKAGIRIKNEKLRIKMKTCFNLLVNMEITDIIIIYFAEIPKVRFCILQ